MDPGTIIFQWIFKFNSSLLTCEQVFQIPPKGKGTVKYTLKHHFSLISCSIPNLIGN